MHILLHRPQGFLYSHRLFIQGRCTAPLVRRLHLCFAKPSHIGFRVGSCYGRSARLFGALLQIWRDTDSGAREPVTIWRPRAPAGYLALGCVAVPDYYEPDRSIIRCIQQEFTIPGKLGEEPIWRDHKGAALWQCSLWQVDNQARTFLARRDHQRPNEDGALAVCNIETFE